MVNAPPSLDPNAGDKRMIRATFSAPGSVTSGNDAMSLPETKRFQISPLRRKISSVSNPSDPCEMTEKHRYPWLAAAAPSNAQRGSNDKHSRGLGWRAVTLPILGLLVASGCA